MLLAGHYSPEVFRELFRLLKTRRNAMKERGQRFKTFICFTLMLCVMMFMAVGTAHSAQPAKAPGKITVVLPAEPDTLDPDDYKV